MIDNWFDINRMVKSGQLKQVASSGYSLPKSIAQSGLKINNEIYNSSYIACIWYCSSTKLILLIRYSFYDKIFEFPLHLKILKSLEQVQKSKIKTINVKFRYLTLKDKMFYYSTYYSVIKEL